MSEPAIRPLEGHSEYLACLALQKRTWGDHFSEAVPPSMLMVAQEVGGVAAGAFEGDRLVGFVFGITGWRDGEPVHWSDMLAVHPDARGRGLGLRLKLYQREVLLAAGVRRMLWTFDPLVARNARLNLTRLGAVARVYRRDVYGDSASTLHAGLGTDRLVAEWDLDSERVTRRLAHDPTASSSLRRPDDTEAASLRELPACNPATSGTLPAPGDRVEVPAVDRIRVVVPAEIMAVREADPSLARRWRLNVRVAFESAIAAGYEAIDAGPGEDGLASYALTRSLRR